MQRIGRVKAKERREGKKGGGGEESINQREGAVSILDSPFLKNVSNSVFE